jgi:hypothetical protein
MLSLVRVERVWNIPRTAAWPEVSSPATLSVEKELVSKWTRKIKVEGREMQQIFHMVGAYAVHLVK